MFLTKKGFLKILIMAICYFILGNVCIGLATLFSTMGVDADILLILGVISYVLDVFFIFWGGYAEGKAKLINRANRLLRKELRPAEFIKEYEALRNAENLIIKKPQIEVLQLVAIAYDCLDDRENCLATVDEMIAVASEKKRACATLVKASFLFSYGLKDEAEALFVEAQKCKLNAWGNALVDGILKSDRAKAMGDYKIAEAYSLKLLEQPFPKLDNLGKLITHYSLGEIYEKLQDNEKAVSHYKYCEINGGETAIRTSATERIQALK